MAIDLTKYKLATPPAAPVASSASGAGTIDLNKYKLPPTAPPAPEPTELHSSPERFQSVISDNPVTKIVSGAAKGGASLFKAISRPFVDLAALPVQGAVAATNRIFKTTIADPYADKALGYDIAPVTEPLKKVGSAVEVAATVAPYGKAATALKPLLGPAWSKIAAGAGGGYAFDVAGNLEEGQKGAGVAKPGLATALGVALPVAGIADAALKNKAAQLPEKYISQLANTYRDAAGATMPTRKVLARSEKRGKDPARFLAERNITPTVKDGKIQTALQADDLHASADPLNEHLDMGLREVQQSIPKRKLADLEREAIRAVRTETNVANNTANDLEAGVRKEFADYRKNYGEEIDLLQENAIKRGKWGVTKFDSTKPLQGDINYAIGTVMKEDIEAAVPKDAFGVHELNSHIGDIYDAEKFLRALDGRAVKGGRLGRYFGRILGAAVGAGHGPAGTFAGTLAGDAVAQILQSTTFSNPMKQLVLRNIQQTDPAAFEKVIAYLKHAGLERELRLALPPPRAIPLPAKTPSPSGVKVLPAAKGPTGVDTKTGQFKKTFLSTPKEEL
ncbi:MAG: hypothetical protein ACK4UO_13050 [Pseudolabrys sp.]